LTISSFIDGAWQKQLALVAILSLEAIREIPVVKVFDRKVFSFERDYGR